MRSASGAIILETFPHFSVASPFTRSFLGSCSTSLQNLRRYGSSAGKDASVPATSVFRHAVKTRSRMVTVDPCGA